MKKMSKVLALLTAGALLFGCMFTSCSNGSGGGGNESGNESGNGSGNENGESGGNGGFVYTDVYDYTPEELVAQSEAIKEALEKLNYKKMTYFKPSLTPPDEKQETIIINEKHQQVFWKDDSIIGEYIIYYYSPDKSRITLGTNANSLFRDCLKAKEIDMSGFDTRDVETMEYMFHNCKSLRSLNIKNFNTSTVKNMSWMFGYCNSLTEIDVSKFNTSSVKNMSNMFYNCAEIIELDLHNFDTKNVTNMYCMFQECTKLQKLDLTSFDFSNISAFTEFFSGDSALKTIYCAENTDLTSKNSSDCFKGCTSLTGGLGTVFDETKTGTAYACIDGGSEKPGYFSTKSQDSVVFYNINITEAENGSVTASKTNTYAGGKVKLTITPAEKKYVLKSLTVKFGEQDIELTQGENELEYSFIMPEGEVSVSATFEIQYYTITFESNGGTAVDPITVEKGSIAKEPTSPKLDRIDTEDGIEYRNYFDGWYKSEDGGQTLTDKYSFSLKVTDNITLYAKWSKSRIYKIETSFDADKGTVSVEDLNETYYKKLLTITPNEGIEIESVTFIDKDTNESIKDYVMIDPNNYKFKQGSKDVVITVTFVEFTYAGDKKIGVDKLDAFDIVFSDGSFMSVDEISIDSVIAGLTEKQKKKAISIIFYKGTALNSEGDTSERTLGVGLNYGDDLYWNKKSLNYTVNIKPIECPSDSTGDLNGKDNFEQMSEYLKKKGKNDPKDDTEIKDNYTAWYWAMEYGSKFENLKWSNFKDGWYMPSIAELSTLNVLGAQGLKKLEIALATDGRKKSMLEHEAIFSSSQHPTSYYHREGMNAIDNFNGLAWALNGKTTDASKETYEYYKGDKGRVIPIREF